MGQSFGSCGDLLETPLGNFISFTGTDKMGNDCTIYKTVCNKCLPTYLEELDAKIEEAAITLQSSQNENGLKVNRDDLI